MGSLLTSVLHHSSPGEIHFAQKNEILPNENGIIALKQQSLLVGGWTNPVEKYNKSKMDASSPNN